MIVDDSRRDSVLADSRATLRQVSGVLRELDGDDEVTPTDLVEILLRAYGELVLVIDTLRQGRGALHQAALERLHRTHDKLQEVTSTTELAASDMLDGLDRALGLLDRLDEGDGAVNGTAVRNDLREELHGLISLLQFQDITSQQLGYASGVLLDVEHRLNAVRDILALTGVELAVAGGAMGADVPGSREHDAPLDPAVARHCDPHASTEDADDRQALADEIFGGPATTA